jgi:hypothetical protein
MPCRKRISSGSRPNRDSVGLNLPSPSSWAVFADTALKNQTRSSARTTS